MRTRRPTTAIFLDRDGVINVPSRKKRYITRWEEFCFLPGALSALRRLSRSKHRLILVSNQAGVGRGIMSRHALAVITRRMREAIRRAGGRLDAAYYCLHPPAAGCRCRKPRLGLIRQAQRRFPLHLNRSFLIGDSVKDIQLGKKAGCRTVLVLTGELTRAAARQRGIHPDKVAPDLSQAARWILQQ